MPLVRKVTIENYKSVKKLSLELGRVNVLIGANGSGKSNILEAIAYGSAASRGKLDNEYLAPRGIRVVGPRFTRSAFPAARAKSRVRVAFEGGFHDLDLSIDPERSELASRSFPIPPNAGALRKSLEAAASEAKRQKRRPPPSEAKLLRLLRKNAGMKDQKFMDAVLEFMRPPDFLVYAPENSALRIFQSEPQILPIGVKGEGLFAHLKTLSARPGAKAIAEIAEHLSVLDWFEKFEIPRSLAPGERSLMIRDRYLAEGALFDQRSANEGFLFLLFYLTVFISDQTPSAFAIDNIDAGLNPRLVTHIVRTLARLASVHEKQVVFTTHNPAVLDGIDLTDDEQRLFVTERSREGATEIRRVRAPTRIKGVPPMPLSEAFLRGYLGGLPKNF